MAICAAFAAFAAFAVLNAPIVAAVFSAFAAAAVLDAPIVAAVFSAFAVLDAPIVAAIFSAFSAFAAFVAFVAAVSSVPKSLSPAMLKAGSLKSSKLASQATLRLKIWRFLRNFMIFSSMAAPKKCHFANLAISR